jgi:2,4-dienoyl-CoA reductase-like NADH-dependent reductase (Old Yellow Enzyme family)/thioredoxin reductase
LKYKFLEPIKIGNVGIKNRVMFLAMAKHLSNSDGRISQRDLAYIKSVADGGAGLVIPGAMVIDPAWPSVLPMQPGIYSDDFIPGLKLLVDVTRQAGARIFFQLWHPGQVAFTKGKTPQTIDQLSLSEIQEIQEKYYAAGLRARAAGADGVEYQMCHNFLGAQFLSPLFNHRHDEYGSDSFENQIRFSMEVIQKLRKAIGKDMALSVKINGSDIVRGGITPELAAKTAAALEKFGVSMFSVSAGGPLTAITGMSSEGDVEEGWKAPFAQAIKAAVSIPVAATGSIRHAEVAQKILEDGMCDMVGMGRTIFAEREWTNKVAADKEDEIRYCISCMACFNSTIDGKSGCTINPFALREMERQELNKDDNGRVVAIVGAGPAGLEAAITLGERGFKPVVFERGHKIGGMLLSGKNAPGKGILSSVINYYEKAIKRSGVEVRFHVEATADYLRQLNPYSVVIATGSVPVTLTGIPGVDKGHVHEFMEVLKSSPNIIGKSVAVIGAGLTGMEIATMLFNKGNEVCLVDIAPPPSGESSPKPAFELLLAYGRAKNLGVVLKMEHRLVEIKNGEVILEDLKTQRIYAIPADYVAVCIGMKSNDDLYNELLGSRPRVYRIGDSHHIGNIGSAVFEGSKLAYALK